jgi:hypothetical protein
LLQFLYKQGDLDWRVNSGWVFSSPSVEAKMPVIRGELLSSVHAAAGGGETTGHVETIQHRIEADQHTEGDLYYAMYRLVVWAEADFTARQILGCNYLVTVASTYHKRQAEEAPACI